MDGSIEGLFLPVKEYFASKSRGWRCGWEREVNTELHPGILGSELPVNLRVLRGARKMPPPVPVILFR
jgi:hypothetical protein